MKTFTVYNDKDNNDSFEVEAIDYEEAKHIALEELGWRVGLFTTKSSEPKAKTNTELRPIKEVFADYQFVD